ncbi:hypothetical protein [Gallintestinimicrobium sp.]|uniref:hypothetical protein n=1 Tax=Gallintestinimicrobium sp. TaxID=2981655 RepID=UPI0039916845
MDKKLLSDYIDACELIRETEQQIRRLQEKQSETTQDSVRGSNPEFPYNSQHFQDRGDNLFDAGRCTAVGKEKAAGRPPGGCRRDTGAGGTLDGYDPGTDAEDYPVEAL